jgi:hypothetical protein
MYKDLSNIIDHSNFLSIQESIHIGLAETRHLALNGTWNKQYINDSITSKPTGVKLIRQAMEEFLLLPDDNMFKVKGLELYKNDFKNFSTYLKLCMQAYDPFYYYVIYENNKYNTDFKNEFTELISWIESSINNKIFDEIKKIQIIVCEHNGISWDHIDLECEKDFIYIRPNLQKPIYIWDPIKKIKIYVDSKIAWWNNSSWIGGERILEQSYALRIEGTFSSKVKMEIEK